jgi:phytanoyl-CoA hydroxylase
MPASAPAQLESASQAFRREGFATVQEPLPRGLIDEADERLGRMMAALGPDQRAEWLVEPHVLASDWRFWLELCRTPTVLDSVAASMGCDELVLLMSHLIVKPPRDGLAVSWHQDNTYWASVQGTDVVTVWLALDDADTGNGCMEVIPCSHAGYPELEKLPTDGADLLQVAVEVSPAMEAAAVPVVLRRGQYSIHDSFIIHGSKPNLSARRRGGYTMRYGNPATVAVDTAIHGKPVYYVRGDGRSLRPEYIDLRPGCALPKDSGKP